MLTDTEISLITGRGGPSPGSFFNMHIYNGNKNITITKVTVFIVTQLNGQDDKKYYEFERTISPLTTEIYNINYIPGENINKKIEWGISNASGFE